MKPLYAYRQLVRRVRRLPLDVVTLEQAKSELRSRFTNGKGPQSSVVRRWLAIFDSILVRHEYNRLHDVFDELFKKRDRSNSPEWMYKLRETDYLSLKPYWPQVELIEDIVSKGDIVTKYNEKLNRQKSRDICVYDFLNLRRHDKERNAGLEKYDLFPVERTLVKSESSMYKNIVSQSRLLFDFLMQHASRLDISNKVTYFEMIYEPTTTGRPWTSEYRDLRLRRHISSIKSLFDSNLPMKQSDITKFASIMLDPKFTINPIFYKVMVRDRKQSLENPHNPLISKYLQLKQLVPSKRNIHHFYRLYILQQYYVDEAGKYQLSWINNYYESDPQLLVPPQKHIVLPVDVKNST